MNPERLIFLILLVTVSCAGRFSAWASTPATAVDPLTQFLLPIRGAELRSRVSLGLDYSRTRDHHPSTPSTLANTAALTLDARIAVVDRLEIGVTMPFLMHRVSTELDADRATRFGDMSLGVKVRVLDLKRTKGRFQLLPYLSLTAPTSSGSEGDHKRIALDSGVIVEGTIGRVTATLNLGIWWINKGQNVWDDVWFTGSLHLGVSPHPVVSLQAGLKASFQVYPDIEGGTDVASSLIVAVRINAIPRLHLELGTQIALNQSGMLLHNLTARATLIVNIGYTFMGVGSR